MAEQEGTRVSVRQFSCLVCQQPAQTEGQLCRACVEAGHSVDDGHVYLSLNIAFTAAPEVTP